MCTAERPRAVLVGPVRYSWEKLARRTRQRHQLCEATTTAALAKREPTAAAVTPPAFGHSPRPSGHNYKNRKAPARRAREGTGWAPGGAPWARATKNVKKPQSRMCESCRKLDLRFFVNQSRNIFDFSHKFVSEVCYCTK